MKILTVADEVPRILYDCFDREYWADIDLILSAGDLKASYLSFLVTMINGAPLYYVRGNHDTHYKKKPPLGCVDIHGQIIKESGLTILGLEGSIWYNGAGIQYREWEMKLEVLRLLPKFIFKPKIDIILTHAPPYQLSDGNDLPHKGFKVFKSLIDIFKPKYFIHGHQHLSYSRNSRIITYNETKIINAYRYHVVEI